MSDADVPMTTPNFGAGGGLRIDTYQAFDYPSPAPRVFAALTEGISMWWTQKIHPEARSVLEPRPGGQWLQTWSNGGACFGTIIHVEVPYRIRIQGPLAMTVPADNVVEWQLEPLPNGGTRLHVTHRGWGLFDQAAADGYEAGWRDTFGSALANYLARG